MSDFKIECGDCVEMTRRLTSRSIDAIITSPPYDGIRLYQSGAQFDIGALGREFARVLVPGGFAVVVIADQKKNKRLSLTTSRLMIDWCDNGGLSLCDWLIYHRIGRVGRFHSFRRDHESILVFFAGDEPRAINTKALKKPVANPRVGASSYVSTRDNDVYRAKRFEVKSGEMDRGSVWHYKTWGVKNFQNTMVRRGDHPAMMTPPLARDLVTAFSSPGDLILDPFCGSGTTGVEAIKQDRGFVGFDISEKYCALSRARIEHDTRGLI